MPEIFIQSQLPTPKPKSNRFLFLGILFFVSIFFIGSLFYGYVRRTRQDRLEREEIARQIQKPQVTVTFIEGKTNNDYFQLLESKGFGTVQQYTEAIKNIDRSVYPLLPKATENPDLQGYLFPDTYKFETGTEPEKIIAKLLNTFFIKLNGTQQQFSQDSRVILKGFEKLTINGKNGLNLNEVVTLASIIEKETGRAGEDAGGLRLSEERKNVAGVFLNRLLIGQALESDATVNFITKAGRASPTYKDLEANSPYNTYKNAGLPPGPIANPSLSSLQAVLFPIKTDFYYFLHKQPSGEVVFSKTFEEHLENKNRYLK